MEMKLDYLRFTVRPFVSVDLSPDGLLNWFRECFPEFFSDEIMTDSELWCNYQHYDFCIAGANRILIYYDSALRSNNKGINVSIPSGGLWIINKCFGCDDFTEFLSLIYNRALGYYDDQSLRSHKPDQTHRFYLKFTRVDICFDDYEYREEGHYSSAKEFFDIASEDRFLTKSLFKNGVSSSDLVALSEDRNMMGSNAYGWTFYLGRRSSDRMLRIYDKYKESDRKRHKYLQFHPGDFDNAPEFVDSVRYEFEIKGAYCNNLVQSIIENVTFSFADFVCGWFKISAVPIDRSNNHQTRDFVEDSKWASFLQKISSFTNKSLWVREKKPSSYTSQQIWLYNSVLPALAVRFAVDGSFGVLESYVMRLFEEDSLSQRYRQMLFEVTGTEYRDIVDKLISRYGRFSDCPSSPFDSRSPLRL